MYTTVDRPDAEDEAYKLQEILSEFNIYASVSADLSKTEMLDAIRRMQDSQFDDGVLGLIVVIMSHGTRGTVEASIGLLDIHDVLMTMSSKKLAGKPKVRHIQQCGRVFNKEISECQLFASQVTGSSKLSFVKKSQFAKFRYYTYLLYK